MSADKTTPKTILEPSDTGRGSDSLRDGLTKDELLEFWRNWDLVTGREVPDDRPSCCTC
jgi:hypothetical protein